MCNHPNIIFNPTVVSILRDPDLNVYVSSPSEFYKSSQVYSVKQLYKLFHPKTVFKEYSSLDPFSQDSLNLLNSAKKYEYLFNGQLYPLYILSPCGNCDSCAKSRSSNIRSRLLLEACTYNEYPLFITLTYNDSCLPQSFDENLNCVDLPFTYEYLAKGVKLFLKRLHINIYRLGRFNSSFRHFVVSEHGSLHNRVHLHLILFNHGVKPLELLEFTDLVRSTWSKGNVDVRQVFSASGLFYVSKYVFKQRMNSSVDEYFSFSTVGGSLGVPYFIKNNINVAHLADSKVTVNYFGSIRELYIPKQIFDYFVKPFCRNFPNFSTFVSNIRNYFSTVSSMHPAKSILESLTSLYYYSSLSNVLFLEHNSSCSFTDELLFLLDSFISYYDRKSFALTRLLSDKNIRLRRFLAACDSEFEFSDVSPTYYNFLTDISSDLQ